MGTLPLRHVLVSLLVVLLAGGLAPGPLPARSGQLAATPTATPVVDVLPVWAGNAAPGTAEPELTTMLALNRAALPAASARPAAGEPLDQAESSPAGTPFARPAPVLRSPDTAVAAAVPPLTRYLCCGGSFGGTYVWSIRYPSGWRVSLVPDRPVGFVMAIFTRPGSSMTLLFAPSSGTPMGTRLDTGDVDAFLDNLAEQRASEHRGFREVGRERVPGVPNARVWTAMWPSGDEAMREQYVVMVSPLPVVRNAPRGMLSLSGIQALDSEWSEAAALFVAMRASMEFQSAGGGSGTPTPADPDDE